MYGIHVLYLHRITVIQQTTNRMEAKQFFTVSTQEVLSTTPEDGLYYRFSKSENRVHVSIDFSKACPCNDGTADESDNECSVIVSCDMGYMYDKTFYGKSALDKAVKFANSKLNNKFLSKN